MLSYARLTIRRTVAEEDNEVEEHTFRGLHFDEWVSFILKVRRFQLLLLLCPHS